MNFLTALLFLSYAIANDLAYQDREVKRKDAPTFLQQATPTGSDIEDVEYFIKIYSDGKMTYELKYEKNDEEISETYSSDGKLIEREEDLKFSAIPEDIRKNIEAFLSNKFKKYKIMEAELRTDEKGIKFYDVEVSHDKATGLTEFSFTPEGKYSSEKYENVKALETHL